MFQNGLASRAARISEGGVMKKIKKLAIKKITLQDLDDLSLREVAGGATTVTVATCLSNCVTCRAVCNTVEVCNTVDNCKTK